MPPVMFFSTHIGNYHGNECQTCRNGNVAGYIPLNGISPIILRNQMKKKKFSNNGRYFS
jgi:hypothetical protein